MVRIDTTEETKKYLTKRGMEECEDCHVWSEIGTMLWEYHMAGECKRGTPIRSTTGDIGVAIAQHKARLALIALAAQRLLEREDTTAVARPGRESLEKMELD